MDFIALLSILTFVRAVLSVDLGDSQRIFSLSCTSFEEVCGRVAASVSSASEVFHPGSNVYQEDISHWASSSTQNAACSFEPGTLEDIGIALQILNQAQTPFAVKGGGHAANPNFSSTEGVQISMTKFSDVVYDPESQTATIGAGLIWDTVYAALEPHGVNVAGGRVPGVGVAGFILGGGYSWVTNQYGLTIDTMQTFELVMPNGTALNVTETSSPDLFFALKGGLNNFGIVTRFTLNTFPQTQVWGGLITYGESVLDRVQLATAHFNINNLDPKAMILTTYSHFLGQTVSFQILFYDGPTPPVGTFDDILAIPSLSQDVKTGRFSSFVASLPSELTYGFRGIFHSISVTDYTLPILQSILNESTYWGRRLSNSTLMVSYAAEPFFPTMYTHNTTPSAYPPDRSRGLQPLLIYYAWPSPDSDPMMHDAARSSARALQEAAIHDGQDVDPEMVYTNYAIFDTPLEKVYGSNLPKLRAIKAAVDPENVMGLAGGFKL